MRREQSSRGRSEAPDCGRGRPPAAVAPTSAALPRGLWRLDTGRSGARAEVAGSPARRGQRGQGATEDTGRGRAERRNRAGGVPWALPALDRTGCPEPTS